ncbi:hypothetical protein EYF80_056566 [Liparis tanakae]|uniref:Uncharacterized protein n=1 Tax=Liparis tanakae TaxID=230148 RepID=A0A4Z2EWE4_9TELE|nr:hypothetical protein EYF80_056566 [Liparis tanakae]
MLWRATWLSKEPAMLPTSLLARQREEENERGGRWKGKRGEGGEEGRRRTWRLGSIEAWRGRRGGSACERVEGGRPGAFSQSGQRGEATGGRKPELYPESGSRAGVRLLHCDVPLPVDQPLGV